MNEIIPIFGVPIQTDHSSSILNTLTKTVADNNQIIVYTPNPEILVRCYFNKEFRLLFSKSLNIPDGVGIRLVKGTKQIKGRELFLSFLEKLDQLSSRILLFGTTSEVIDKSMNRIRASYPHIQVNGISDVIVDVKGHCIDSNGRIIDDDIIQLMKKAKPDVVFAALGAPKQEFWIDAMKHHFPQTSFMAIGGTLDTYSGSIPLPPEWMSRYGFEWLFRLLLQPKRFGRIATAVFVFPLVILLDSMFSRFRSKDIE